MGITKILAFKHNNNRLIYSVYEEGNIYEKD